MSYTINATQLQTFVPALAAAQVQPLTDAINATLDFYSISQSPRRVRYFMAQSCFESASYTAYYSTPERLCAVWPSRFSMECTGALAYAPDYTGNPQKLANLVYANREGNGDVNSGDGYSFRGRGAFQLTFRNNYTAYSQMRYGDDRIVQNPDLVAQPADAMMSAGWFWSTNGLNTLADGDQFTNATRVINGSTSTVPQRLPVLNRANSVFTW
jgi:putative chitinase